MTMRSTPRSFAMLASRAFLMLVLFNGCGGSPQVADAPDEPEPELTPEEIKAEEAYARTTRSY